ncbi:MAG: PQQ-binding-like beta-propeller repeat protein [Planctomycetaceae bacterium]
MQRELTAPDLKSAGSLFTLLSSGLLLAICSGTVSAEDWPQFRGPNCDGLARSTAALPTKFSADENVLWSNKLGDGIGCPIVAAGRVFTSSMIDDQTVGLSAFDAVSGRQLWQRQWPTGLLVDVHKTNSHAATTPAADAHRVYFYFSTLGLLALDAHTGQDVWHQKLPTPYFVFKWGPAMSPTLYKNMVLFVQDDDLNPALYAFDKTSGRILWKDDRSDQAVNYSHPIVCQTPNGDEIVVAGTGMLIGYAPTSGRRLWQARTLLRNIKTTPVSHGGVIYVSLQSGGIANQWLATADQSDTGNKDGKLTKAEMQAFVGKPQIPAAFFKKTFDRGDKNGDGQLAGRELDVAFLHPDNFAGARFDAEETADEYVLAVRGGGRGDVTATHVLWKHKTRYTDHIVSPIVINKRMLLIKGGGIGTCFETEAGKQLWGPKRIQNEGGYFASPVYGDGKIFIAGENGNVVVLQEGPELKILARNNMGASILGTPAISDGRLFIRTRNALICVGQAAGAQ